jgi:hypothetical protein
VGRWYVQKTGTVRGPFPTGAVVQERLVGRILDADLVSLDQNEWKPFACWPELAEAIAVSAPPGSASADDDWFAERTHARVRWADQRNGQDRRAAEESTGAAESTGKSRQLRRGSDRRMGKEVAAVARAARPARRAGILGSEIPLWWLVAGLTGLAVLLGVLIYLFGPVNPVAVRIR